MGWIRAHIIRSGEIISDLFGLPCYSAAALVPGTLVYVSGWSETNKCRAVTKSDADAADSLYAAWVVRAGIGAGSTGRVYKTYRLGSVNTGGSSEGAKVYASATAGGWTLTAPSGANAFVQVVGRVAVVSATVGVIEFDLFSERVIAIGSQQIQGGSTTPSSFTVYNGTGSPIAQDALLTVNGYNVANAAWSVTLADADAGGKQATLVALTAIADASTGTAYKSGLSVATLNTSAAASQGDPVYLDTTAGGWTLIAPTGLATGQIVGQVKVKDAAVGQIAWNLWLNYPFSRIGFRELQRQTDATFLMGKGVAADIVAQALSGDITVDTAGAATLASSILKTVTLTLTNAQIKALRATPITIVAAPGAGKVITPVECSAYLKYGGTNIFGGAANDNLGLKWKDGSTASIMTGGVQAWIQNNTSCIAKFVDAVAAGSTINVSKANADNQALVVHNITAGEIINNAANDNTIIIVLSYRVDTVAW